MRKQQQGFTLVELAIVLVIIGVILGMAFKGRALIDQARVKSMQAQYSKIAAGFNLYFDRYGRYPGDGCPANSSTPAACTHAADAVMTTEEGLAAMPVLVGSTILGVNDVVGPNGQNWIIQAGGANSLAAWGNTAGMAYLTLNPLQSVDPRYACALDRLMDDGLANSGDVRSSGGYSTTTDCWDQNNLAPAGVSTALVSLGIRILP